MPASCMNSDFIFLISEKFFLKLQKCSAEIQYTRTAQMQKKQLFLF